MAITSNDGTYPPVRSLVDRCREGNMRAFEELVRRFQDMAYHYSLSILRDEHAAQDAAQEAFLLAYQKLPDLDEAAAFPGWFRRVVWSCSTRAKRSTVRDSLPLDAASAVPDPSTSVEVRVEQGVMREALLDAVATLPEHERGVVMLAVAEDRRIAEIARFLEVPVGTVKRRLHSARARLRERMGPMIETDSTGFRLPDDFADVVVRKAQSQNDLDHAATVLPYHSKQNPGAFSSAEAAKAHGLYVAGATRAEGAGLLRVGTWGIGRTTVPCAYPQEVSREGDGVPHPQFRAGMLAGFKQAQAAGAGLVIAHGSQFDHGLCGFVPAFYYPVATLPMHIAKSVETDASIRLVEDEEERARAEEACRTDPATTNHYAFLGGGTSYHRIVRGECAEGYVCIDAGERIYHFAERYDMPFGFVSRVSVRTRGAALAVLEHLAELTEPTGSDRITLIESHRNLATKTILALGGSYLLRPSCPIAALDAEMAAIVDFPLLISQLEPELSRRLPQGTPLPDAAFSLELSGQIVGFEAKAGTLRLLYRRQHHHRRLPRWVLTRLVMGYYSGSDVLSMGPLPWDRSDGKNPDDRSLDMRPLELPEAEAELFARLFPKLWPCGSPDPDVWPWINGNEAPRYRNGNEALDVRGRIDALRFPWVGY